MAGRVPVLAWLERLLVVVGVVCLGYYGYKSVEARQFQREQAAAFEARLISEAAIPAREQASSVDAPDRTEPHLVAPDRTEPHLVAPGAPNAPGAGVVAHLDIPRLGLSTPVLSGDDEATLDRAVGHLPDTPKPWEPGNSAFAAHRDGLFRPIRHIRIGDELRVRTTEGEFTYRVSETKVVSPTDLSVLEPSNGPTLTLITCYPFNYVGNAPKRFIVHANRIDGTLQ